MVNNEAYGKALKYLKQKLRSKGEVINYLKRLKVTPGVIKNIISCLQQEGYLDEEQFAFAYSHDRFQFSRAGLGKIKGELRARGLELTVIEKALGSISKEQEQVKLKRLINQQFKLNERYRGAVLRQRLLNYGLNLGFQREMITTYLTTFDFNQTGNLVKEFTCLKAYYQGQERRYKITKKLLAQGYHPNEIDQLWQ